MNNGIQVEQSANPAGNGTGLLRAWYREYIAADSNRLAADSEIIRTIESDKLDHDEVERQVRQLMSTMGATQGFCGKCRHLLEHWPDLSTEDSAGTVSRTLDTNEIEAAARNGCHFCAFLLSRVKAAGLLDTLRKIEARLRILGDSGTASLSIGNWDRGKIKSQRLWVNLPGKIAAHYSSHGAQATQFESHTMSPTKGKMWQESSLDSFDIANIWLRECSTSHKRCSGGKKYARPTRMISINDERIKLVPTVDWEIMPRYATLSYCWGGGEFTMLTSENLDSFYNAIDLDHLPKTFQDAVHIARKLDLKYLWIDALCIIQNQSTNADWLRESALMCSVYGGAYVNLAASSATSVRSGCFLKPKHHSGGFCTRVTATATSMNTTGELSVVRNFHIREVYEESCTRTHLAGRAWSLQEKLLAPRTLFFGVEGLFWECRTKIASEFLPDGFLASFGSHMVQPEYKPWFWSDIVSHYSGAALTFGTDKLPALSGMATRQRDATGNNYLAGMWREDLAIELPWQVVGRKNRKKRPAWRAPSWSWTSIDGQVTYLPYGRNDTDLKRHIYVLDAWTKLVGPDPCGAVVGGELSVGCSALARGRVQEQHGSRTDRMLLEAGSRPVRVDMDCLDDEAFIRDGDGSVYLLPVSSGKPGSKTGRQKQDNESQGEEEGDREENMEWFEHLIICGLVLQRCDGHKGRFRRIGSFHLEHNPFPDEYLESEKNRYYHELMAVLDEVGAATAEVEGAEVISNSNHPEARYVITIK